MPIFVTSVQDMQDKFRDTTIVMIVVFVIVVILMIVLFIASILFIFSRLRKSTPSSINNVKAGENSKYFSGYGKAKKNTKKEKRIQRASSKSTKICKTCGNFIPKDVEICSFCGSTEV